MTRRRLNLIGTAAAVACLATVLGQQASVAKPTPDPDPAAPNGMYSAMQRDLDLTAPEAKARLSDEEKAARTERKLRKELGTQFGGAWFDADKSRLVVGVVDDADAATVRDAGAAVSQVELTEDQLDTYKAKLDAKKAKAPETTPGWYVDVVSNTIVVQSRDSAADSAKEFAKRAGVPADAVTVKSTTESPRTFIDVIGGNAYFIGGSRCSIGFSVSGGFVTAGHCGTTGAATSQPSGTFGGSSFPGNDYAHVRTAAGNTPLGVVNDYAGGTVPVGGSQDSAVGSSICRSGSTTGWHCGTIQARNSTVTYPQGTVTGLIRTNVCAEPGDSGGSAISGTQAQGVTSGGSGNCSIGGTTYFQPVNEILQVYGLSLITSGGTPPGGTCTGPSYSGSLSSGGSAIHPNGSYYYSGSSGTHKGCLDGPSGSDFDLYLQKWSGSSWVTVAQGTSAAADETVTYSGTSGYYSWVVDAYSGSGSYTLGTNRP
ncbi:S1 family peptidase [Aeromicrobium sp.]|uniref:S1 family peptidase n=1 Tax=Aeromicrobium sp. TaxID=1871063 RepID=UPI003D6A23AC